jgi:hypothetical protein
MLDLDFVEFVREDFVTPGSDGYLANHGEMADGNILVFDVARAAALIVLVELGFHCLTLT